MTDISRQNPAAGMTSLRDAMNQLLADSFVSPYRWSGSDHKPLDLYETEQEYVAKLAVPGLKPDDFEITLQENVLTVSGQTQQEQTQEHARYHIQEQHFGSFSRSIRFPGNIQVDQVEASLNNGILSIRVPKAEEAKPKRISVKVS
jgi:HSP20 family protein